MLHGVLVSGVAVTLSIAKLNLMTWLNILSISFCHETTSSLLKLGQQESRPIEVVWLMAARKN